MRSLDDGAYLPELARHLTAGCPELIAKLDAEVRQAVNEPAAKAVPTRR